MRACCPWQFICVQDAARVRLGGALATAYMCRHCPAKREQVERELMGLLRAPMMPALAAAITPNHARAEVIDPRLAAGAEAMSLLTAAHTLGCDGMRLTGESCFDADIKRALGLAPDDFTAGWLCLGTPSSGPAPARRSAADEVLRDWTGLPA